MHIKNINLNRTGRPKFAPVATSYRLRLFSSLLGVAFFLVHPGCSGDSTHSVIPLNTTSCSAGTAALEVGDSYLRILCGCTGAGESDGRIYPTPGALTCRVANAGTVVFFHYLTTTLPHQIVSTDNGFVSSGISDPSIPGPVRNHAALFSTASTTYSFKDIYTGMTGQITTP